MSLLGDMTAAFERHQAEVKERLDNGLRVIGETVSSFYDKIQDKIAAEVKSVVARIDEVDRIQSEDLAKLLDRHDQLEKRVTELEALLGTDEASAITTRLAAISPAPAGLSTGAEVAEATFTATSEPEPAEAPVPAQQPASAEVLVP